MAAMPHHVRLYPHLFVSILALVPLMGCHQADRWSYKNGKAMERLRGLAK